MKTLVLCPHTKYRERLQGKLTAEDDPYWLYVGPEPVPTDMHRFEELLTNADLITIDAEIMKFVKSWHMGVHKEFIHSEYTLKQFMAQPAKVLAILNAHKPERVVFVSGDHMVRSFIKSYAAFAGLKHTMIPTGIPHLPSIRLPMMSEFMPGQKAVNDEVTERFRKTGKKNVLYAIATQSSLELEAVEKSDKIQPIIFAVTNYIEPEILGNFPIELVPGQPTEKSMTYPRNLFEDVLTDLSWIENLKFLGVPMNEDAIWTLRDIVCSQMARYYDVSEWFKRVVEKWDIKAVVVNQDSFTDERAVVMTANDMCIPTFVLQHGWYADWYPPLPKPIGKYLCTWGERATKAMQSGFGAEADNMRTIGTSRMQLMKTLTDSIDAVEVKRKLGIPQDKPVVLFAGNAFVEFFAHMSRYEMNEMVRRVIKDFQGSKDLFLVVRNHPYSSAFEPDDIKNAVINEHLDKSCMIADSGVPATEALAIADIVVSHESTLMVEALYMGKKVVELSVPGKVSMFQFDGGTIKIPPDNINPEVANVYEVCRDILLHPETCQLAIDVAKDRATEFLKGVVSDESGAGLSKLLEATI